MHNVKNVQIAEIFIRSNYRALFTVQSIDGPGLGSKPMGVGYYVHRVPWYVFVTHNGEI